MSALSHLIDLVSNTDTGWLDEDYLMDASPTDIAEELYAKVRAEVASELAPGHRAEVLREAIAAVEDPEQREKSPIGMGLGWESAREVLRRLLHETIGQQITGYARGAWTPGSTGESAGPDLHTVILTAVQSFRSSAQAEGSWSQQLAEHLLTAVAPLVPYREVWSAELPPGGAVCGICGQPVESEPCPDHAPAAPEFFQPGCTYTDDNGYRAPELTTLFRVEHVTRHPDRSHLRAIGWMRSGTPNAPWHGHFQDEGEFDGWTEVREDGEPQPQDACDCLPPHPPHNKLPCGHCAMDICETCDICTGCDRGHNCEGGEPR